MLSTDFLLKEVILLTDLN